MSATVVRYESRDQAPEVPAQAPLQRGDGSAEIVFGARGGATVLVDLYQRTPCRVLFPRGPSDEPPVGVLLTTSGGLTGGDRLRIVARVGAGAAATVTTQAAEKIYRAAGSEVAIVTVALSVAEHGWLEYLPQETILFDGARLERQTAAVLASGARLLACETVVFGRGARGESFARGLLHDAWRIRRGEKLVWADTLHLDGDIAGAIAAPAGFRGAGALATALYVGDDAQSLAETARSLAEGTGCRGGVSLVNGILVGRFFGDKPSTVRGELMRYIAGMRHAAAGFSAALPGVWHS